MWHFGIKCARTLAKTLPYKDLHQSPFFGRLHAFPIQSFFFLHLCCPQHPAFFPLISSSLIIFLFLPRVFSFLHYMHILSSFHLFPFPLSPVILPLPLPFCTCFSSSFFLILSQSSPSLRLLFHFHSVTISFFYQPVFFIPIPRHILQRRPFLHRYLRYLSQNKWHSFFFPSCPLCLFLLVAFLRLIFRCFSFIPSQSSPA